MIECKKNKAKVTESTCIARQKIIAEADERSAEGKHLRGIAASKYGEFKRSCGGCEIGIALYKKNLESIGAVKKKDVETRACRDCTGIFELNADNFYREGDGFEYSCKTCRNKARKAHRAANDAKNENRVTLDFREEPELLVKLKSWSKANRRSPEQQIIYFIENDLE